MINLVALGELRTLGFIMGEKTLDNDVFLPQYQVPRIKKRESNYAVIHEAILNSVAQTLENHPDTALGLSGGLDTRLIAGAVSELDYDIPVYTFYSRIESMIAERVCKKLGLSHHFYPSDYTLSPEQIAEINKLKQAYAGTRSITQIHLTLQVKHILEELGCNGVLHGGRLNELLGFTVPRCGPDAFFKRLAKPGPYYDLAHDSFMDETRDLSIDEISLYVRIPATLPRIIEYDLPRFHYIYLDECVVSSIYSLPYEMRRSTELQHHLLKRYHPELYRIPSLGSCNNIYGVPETVSKTVIKAVNRIYHSLGKPRPVHTFDAQYFTMKNKLS